MRGVSPSHKQILDLCVFENASESVDCIELPNIVVLHIAAHIRNHHIRNHHENCFEKSTNMPGISSIIREINVTISEF